jgi:hypothetical protein
MKRNAEEAQAGPEDVEEAVRAVREQSRRGPAEEQS